ncbi:MAG: ribonuclease P [Candidatus Aenigmarchaeota archaeon]|nr:ribonuclease P [Candidatus Aenigmarchaeota archaeon]
MDFYDLHAHVEDLKSVEEIVEIAKRIGYSGIGLTVKYANIGELRRLKEKINELKSGIDIATCVEIDASGVKELRRKVSKARKLSEVIVVSGGDYKINRAACEDSRVDILAHPEYKRSDSGIDHIVVRAAHENNVAIEINFHEILETYRKIRAHVLSHMRRNVMLAEEYNAPIIITSGARSKWELRGPRELSSVGQVLGMSLENSMKSVSDVPRLIVETNRRKLKVLPHG